MSDDMPPAWAVPMLRDIAALKSDALETRTALMDRMDRLQNSVTGIQDDITVSLASVERAERNTQAVREEGRGTYEMLTGVIRQVGRLQAQMDELRDKR